MNATDAGPVTITREKLSSVQIVASASRSPDRPNLCAVFHILPDGRRELPALEDELKNRRAAELWIEHAMATAPDGSASE